MTRVRIEWIERLSLGAADRPIVWVKFSITYAYGTPPKKENLARISRCPKWNLLDWPAEEGGSSCFWRRNLWSVLIEIVNNMYSVLCTLYGLQIFIRPFQACIWSNFSFLNRLPKEYLAGLLILIPVHIQQQRKRSKESCQMINSNRITIDGLSTSLWYLSDPIMSLYGSISPSWRGRKQKCARRRLSWFPYLFHIFRIYHIRFPCLEFSISGSPDPFSAKGWHLGFMLSI